MPGDYPATLIYQHRHCKTELGDRPGDLPDLRGRMRPGIPRIRDERLDGNAATRYQRATDTAISLEWR